MERSLILLKPDAVGRRLVGKIITRIEEKGLWFIALKVLQPTQAVLDQHYNEHKERPFFKDLCSFMSSSPVVAGVVEGPGCVDLIRAMLGKTKVTEAVPGTIRGDYSLSTQQNLMHASDSPASAEREIPIWFLADELVTYRPCDGPWVHESIK
ncbi:nucleoside-diphosphate kinase [bacterium]|nr:nucleoside-diphosphate kinase [bacterium]